MRPDSAAFRQSRPILLTAFTNKVGSIGLTLTALGILIAGLAFPVLIHADGLSWFTFLIVAALVLLLGVLYGLKADIERLS